MLCNKCDDPSYEGSTLSTVKLPVDARVTEGYYSGGNFYYDSAHTRKIEPLNDSFYIDKTDTNNLKLYFYSNNKYTKSSGDEGGNAVWGEIEGTLSAQTDLNTALNAKANQTTTYTKTEVDTALGTKANQSTTYTKTEVDTALSTKANQSNTYTKTEVDTAVNAKVSDVKVNGTSVTSSGVANVTTVQNLTSALSTDPLAANQGKVLKDLIDSYLTSGAGAPTTSTVGTVGKLYQDTTNGKLYQCTAINEGAYIWSEVGASIVQTTGTSTTDVMSQKASTELIFKPNTQPSSNVLKIGSISNRSPSNSIAIGWGGNGPLSSDSISIGKALCNGSDSIAIGAQGACSSGTYSIFIGRGDNGSSMKAGSNSVAIGGLYPSAAGSMCVALGSNARTIDNVNGATAIGYMSRVGKAGTVGIGAYSGNNDASQDVAGTVYFNSRETAYGYNNSNYRLLTGLYDGQNAHDAATVAQALGDTETYTITTSDWTALASATPYTYSATVTATHTIGNNTIVELYNDNPVLFATNGFAVGSVSGQSVVLYSIGIPSASVSLKVNYKG